MRSGSALLLLAISAVVCAEDMPVGFFHGKMLRWEGTVATGVLSATASDGRVLGCHYDKKTFIELEKWRVNVDKLIAGDLMEVLAEHRLVDRATGVRECYIMSLEVLPEPKPVRPGRPKETKTATTASLITPSRPKMRLGSETFAGIVVSITDTSLTLRTREGVQTFQLRKDTRYLGEGLRMEKSDVTVNQRVSVEGASVDGVMEAYQLVWGSLTVR